MKRLVDHDNFTGLTTYHDYDSLTDITTVSYVQDVEPCLEQNKILANNSDYTDKGIKNEIWHYASIPAIVQMKWKKDYGIDIYDKNAQKQIMRLLNSQDYRYLKTTAKFHA